MDGCLVELAEFLRSSEAAALEGAFAHIVGAAAWLGALRLYAKESGVALDFDGLKLTFIDNRTLAVDVAEMVRKVFARSSLKADMPRVVARLEEIVAKASRLSEICSGKDVLSILSQALCRHYKCCPAGECSTKILSRVLRVAATLEDLQDMTLYQRLSAIISTVPFRWAGVAL
jgi:hypothetical protein